MCQSDPETDRPTFGRTNVCPTELPAPTSEAGQPIAFSEIETEAWIKTLMHETYHILGLSSTSYSLYRDSETGEPLTARSAGVPSNPAASTEVEFSCQGTTVSRSVASTDTITFHQERGMTCTGATDLITQGMFSCVQRVIVPPSRDTARSFFGCTTLPGIELENQDTTSCVIHPSHTEARVQRTDLMNAVKLENRAISAVSLSVLDSSGWYKANYSAAAPMLYNRDFGF